MTTPEILENCSKEMLENEYMEESFTGYADLQLSVHGLYSHLQKSSEAVSTDLDNQAHPRAPCRRCPLTAGGPHTLTPTQIMNQKLLLQSTDSSQSIMFMLQLLVIVTGPMDTK